jgi:hypothetical protein
MDTGHITLCLRGKFSVMPETSIFLTRPASVANDKSLHCTVVPARGFCKECICA